MTHRKDIDYRPALVAALYNDHPPAGATPDVLRAWACRQIDQGEPEGGVAIKLGWTVGEVRAALAERARR